MVITPTAFRLIYNLILVYEKNIFISSNGADGYFITMYSLGKWFQTWSLLTYISHGFDLFSQGLKSSFIKSVLGCLEVFASFIYMYFIFNLQGTYEEYTDYKG